MLFRTVIVAVILFTSSCAYYNTFYNARKSYREAVDIATENPDNPSSREEVLLEEAIAGAGKVLSFYPDSKWIDDAQLLIGDALLMLGTRSLSGSGTSDLEEAMRAYSSVLVMTQDTEIADHAYMGMGRAAFELGRFSDAAASFENVSEGSRSRYVISRLHLSESLVSGNEPGKAIAVLDTLGDAGSDSLRAEVMLARGRALLNAGEPENAALECLGAGEVFGRGNGYYRALIAAAEAWISAGRASDAADVLDHLLLGYRSDLEMATISLLTGKAHLSAGDMDNALVAFRAAADLDSYREYGAEALYHRALLLENRGRRDEALETLTELSNRGGGYLWIRLAADRKTELQLLSDYSDELETADRDEKYRFMLLIAEKRLDLYGPDSSAISELRIVASEGEAILRAIALTSLVELNAFPRDSSEIVLLYARSIADSSDLATRIEDRLGLERGAGYPVRPSVVLEASWERIGDGAYAEAWVDLSRLLDSQWSYELEPRILWAAYVASESARMDDNLVEGYLRSLTEDYPDTEEGRAAIERLGESDEEGEGDE